jgi:hypothetical protein
MSLTLRTRRLSHGRAALLLASLAVGAGACIGPRDSRHALSGQDQPPLGVVDEPREGATARSSFRVSGWAGDDRGLSAVRVFLDGHLVALGAFSRERPDVSTVYPQFRHGTDRHGWETIVETVAGPHTIRVEAVDIAGATTDLGTRTLVVVTSGGGQ